MANTADLAISDSSHPDFLFLVELTGVGAKTMARQFNSEGAVRDFVMAASAAGARKGITVVIRDDRR